LLHPQDIDLLISAYQHPNSCWFACSPLPFPNGTAHSRACHALSAYFCWKAYRLQEKDFGLRYRSEPSTTYWSVRLTWIPPSSLAKILFLKSIEGQ
jgi:hypothetical protein